MASPATTISPDNRGPELTVISWVLLALSGLSVVAKVGVKSTRGFKFDHNDLFLSLALIFALGFSIALPIQVSHGLGRTSSGTVALSALDLNTYQKAGFATEFMYILAIGSTKLAGFALIRSLSPFGRILSASWIGFNVTLLWVLVALLGIAFQCPLPNTWTILSPQCFDQSTFWIFIGSIDILIDLCLILLPLVMLWRLETTLAIKMTIWSMFSVRTLVVAATVSRLVYISPVPRVEAGILVPSNSFAATMATVFAMHSAIIATAALFLKPLIDDMQHGVLTSDLIRGPNVLFSAARSRQAADSGPLHIVNNERASHRSIALSRRLASRSNIGSSVAACEKSTSVPAFDTSFEDDQILISQNVFVVHEIP